MKNLIYPTILIVFLLECFDTPNAQENDLQSFKNEFSEHENNLSDLHLDGSYWDPVVPDLLALNNSVYSIAATESGIYLAGVFTNAGGNPDADKIAKWNGTSWEALGEGLNNIVYDIAAYGSDVYACGTFTDAGGNADADKIAKRIGMGGIRNRIK